MRTLLEISCEQSQISRVARHHCKLHEGLFQSYIKGMLTFCRVEICYQDIYYSPDAFRFILLEVQIELEAFFYIESQCGLAHSLFCLALALILGLALICLINCSEVVV